MTNVVERLQVILKTVERCNIACTYCYYFYGGDESYKKRPPYILDATVDGLISFLRDGIKDCSVGKVEIVFHGGEPLMQSKSKFNEMCEKIQSSLSKITKLNFSIQTNGMLVDEEWIDLFVKFDIALGVSIDGNEMENDKSRIDKIGRGTYHRAVEGFSKLLNAYNSGKLRQSPALLTVINPEYDYSMIVKHFYEALGARRVGVLLPDINYDELHLVEKNMKGYTRALKSLFDMALLYEDLHIIQVEQVLLRFQRFKLKKEMKNKVDSSTLKIGNQIIVVQSDGELTLDDSFIPATDWRSQHNGVSIFDISLEEHLEREVFTEIRSALSNRPERCTSCDMRALCNSGDLENRYSKENGFDNPSVYCTSLYEFYTHAVSYLYNNGYPKDGLLKVLDVK